MSEQSKDIDLSSSQMKEIAGGGSGDSGTFTEICSTCGAAFTVSKNAREATCPNCGQGYAYATTYGM